MGPLAALLALFVSALLIEAALRLFWNPPDRRGIRMFEFHRYLHQDPELGWIPRADALVEYPRFQATFRTNQHGLRGPAQSGPRRPGMGRMLVLGDSFAWGHGVGEGEAFPEVLESKLPNVEVVNLGVPGFNLRTALGFYRRLGREFKADVVLLAICQNDVVDHRELVTPTPAGRLDTEHGNESSRSSSSNANDLKSTPGATQPESTGLLRTFKDWLSVRYYTYMLIREAAHGSPAAAALARMAGLMEPPGGFEMLDDNLHAALIKPPPAVERALQTLENDLLAICAEVKADGSRLAVALIPARQAVEPQALERSLAYVRYSESDFDLERPYLRLSSFASRQGLEAIAPLEAFRAASARGEDLYLPDDPHFSPDGHRLFAEAVAPCLRRLLEQSSDHE